MKIGLLGGHGQLGTQLCRTAHAAGHSVVAPTSAEVNLTDANSIRDWVTATNADAWINAAAYTAVDAAEDNEELAYRVNRDGARTLADAVGACNGNAPLIYFSTDYVFPGTKGSPYTETDATDPQSVYGASKLAGEQASLSYKQAVVMRISWVFGSNGHNFVRAILRAARRFDRDGGKLKVVDDQFGAPCGTASIANTVMQLLATNVPAGIYHFGSAPHTDWHSFAEVIVEESVRLGLLTKPIEALKQPTSALNQRATRPPDGRMDSTKLQAALGTTTPPWRDDLITVLTEWAKLTPEEIDGPQS